jgi:serine/threonine-protein kinase
MIKFLTLHASPEQVMGRTDVDHRVDIWALGVIAYQCLLGIRPFEGETLGSLLMAICHEPLPIPSTKGAVPTGFDNWFARAAARDPNERFSSIMDAVTYLRVMCRLASSQPPPGW